MNIYADLEKKIKLEFKDKDLLKTAFVHRSYVNEHRKENLTHNERLEFLGDAVLELAATDHLYRNYQNQPEGEMTAFRSALVKGVELAKLAEELNLGKYLHLSKGEELSGGRQKKYILANTVEALIGAIYLQHGYKKTENFIKNFILKKLDEIIEKKLHIDSKTRFQEICQEREGVTPYYELLKDEGPDHDKKFTMGAYIERKLIAEGSGSSKQKAEEAAATKALKAKKWN